MPKYILVAETGSDIPQDLANRYNIAIVPMHVTFGGRTYDDGSMLVEQIFEHYRTTRELPKTSGSMPADFKKVFDEIHEAHPDAIIIHLAYSAVTTCSYESAQTAAEGRSFIHSFDTKSVGAGQAMVVLSIAQLLEQSPDIELSDLTKEIEDRVERILMVFFPGDLDYLRAGGRVSNASYIGAQLLRITPLIEIIDGHLTGTKKYRGQKTRIVKKMMVDYLSNTELEKECLFFIYSPGLDKKIMEDVTTQAHKQGFKKIAWLQTGCVISSHAGPGAFGMVGFSKTRM